MVLLKIHSHRWHIHFSFWSHLKTSRSFTGHTQTSHRTAYKQTETDAIAKIKQSQHGIAFKPHVPFSTFSMGHVSPHCVPVKSSTLSLEKECLNWHTPYLHFFPVVRSLPSSAPAPGSGTADGSHRQAHIPPAGRPHRGSSTALHCTYCTRFCPKPSPGSLLLLGAQPKTREHEIRQRIKTGTHQTGEHNPFIYLWVQVSQPDLQPARPFMHFLSHTY